MELREIDIHELLPQREPFITVGRLVSFDLQSAATETEVQRDSIFVENERLSAYGIIENIAQTCAAKIGYYNKYILKKDVLIGVIGAIRNLNITGSLPKIGETIKTKIETLEEVFGMTLVKGIVTANDEEVAVCEMKIAIYDMKSA